MRTPARFRRGVIRSSRAGSMSHAMMRPWFFMLAARPSVLPPAPAHRSTTVSPGCAPASATISWLERSCTSTSPSANASLFSTGAPASVRKPLSIKGNGTASMPSPLSAATAASRVAFKLFTLRSSGARPISPRRCSGQWSPNRRANRASSHSGSQSAEVSLAIACSSGVSPAGAWPPAPNSASSSGSCALAKAISAARPEGASCAMCRSTT